MAKRPRLDPNKDGSIEIMAVGPDGELLTVEAVPVSVGDLIAEVTNAVVPSAREAGPDKFGVEFGIRLRKDGSVTLAEDPARSAFRIFLEWSNRDR